MTCPRCGGLLLAEVHPWVLSDDGNGKTRVFDSDRRGEPDIATERHRCA